MVTLPKVLPAPYIRGVIALYSRHNDAFDSKNLDSENLLLTFIGLPVMIRHSLRYISLIVLSAAVFFSACDDTTIDPAVFVPSAPTGLQACSVNDSTVRITFTASASESNSAFKDYLLVITNGSYSQSISLPKGFTYFDISPLQSGKAFTFKVSARTADTISSSISIDWAAATRYVGIRAYDRSSVLGSGIDLLNGTNQTIASADLWDLCFDSSDSTFGSPGPSAFADVNTGKIGGKTPKRTYIFAQDADTPYTITADSLNAVYETKALNDTTSMRKKKVEGLLNVRTSKSYVFYVITGDNRFAKILVKAKNGAVIQRDANGSFVEIDASVQKMALIPYAMKSGSLDFNGPAIRATRVMRVTNQ
jgi:hypothetical protein